MPTKRPTGKTIDVDRIISVGRDRKTGRATVRVRDAGGARLRATPLQAAAADSVSAVSMEVSSG